MKIILYVVVAILLYAHIAPQVQARLIAEKHAEVYINCTVVSEWSWTYLRFRTGLLDCVEVK